MFILDPSHQVHSRDALSIQSLSHYASNWACPELIYEILTYCLSGVTLRTDAPRSFPWYLGHICQSWRSVFVSSPRFWDHFSFEFLPTGNIRHQRALALLELCIERTKNRPFSFKFTVICHTRLSRLFLDTLVAHADRWRAACLIADGKKLRKSLNKAKGRFRQLHSLQISHFRHSSHRPSHVFQDAPNLTRVWARDYYQLPWSTLSVLHIDGSLSTHRLFENLAKATCLEELVISGSHCNAVNTSPIELPSLKMLSVDRFPPGLHIKTPALERLYLVDPLRADLPTATTLLHGVNHLKTLLLYVDNVQDARVIEWTPELNHLILSCDNYTPIEVFQPLFQSLTSYSTAYSLRRISVDIRNLIPDRLGLSIFIINGLSTIIKSWGKYQFPMLRFASVHVNNDHSNDITSAIADLMRVGADKGIEIDVNSSPLPTVLPSFESW